VAGPVFSTTASPITIPARTISSTKITAIPASTGA
jgi:hypothetical protein